MPDYTFKKIRTSSQFILPLVVFVIVFILLPVIGTVISSFYKDIAYIAKEYSGLNNFRTLVKDHGFLQSLRFTALFIIAAVPLELLIGLIFALILNEALPIRGLLRVCVLIPWAIPSAISARVWELIYNYSYGLANFLLMSLKLSPQSINWLGTTNGAFFALVIADTWKTAPFVAIILLAGLQTIPKEIYQQAKVDRANFVQRFLYLTLPLLKPVLIVALLFRTIDTLRIFDIIYVLTRGGPGGATSSLSLYGYKYFLAGDFGYGSAVSVILFIIAMGLSISYIKLGRFGEELR
jgi:multiple sugar transport system permease protein